MMILSLVVCLIQLTSVTSLVVAVWGGTSCRWVGTGLHCEKLEQHDRRSCLVERENLSLNRRGILSTVVMSIVPIVQVDSVSARDELFKENPLLNPILEQFRIWDQAEADQTRYGGELAPGSALGRETYAKLLVPILRMNQDIITIHDLLRQPNGVGFDRADKLLSQPQYEKIGFKKIFNAFADNIYYSDPDRANLYLAGGAVPKTEQSLAYLLRNDILNNIESLQAEIKYLIKERIAGRPIEVDDLLQYSEDVKVSMSRYLELVPPSERENASKLL